MSIEQLLQGVIEALNKNTAALEAAAGKTGTAAAASTGETATTGKGAGKGKAETKTKDEPKGPTVEEMQAVLTQVKEKFGAAEAKAIIKSAGGVDKMAEIPEKKVKAVFDAATAKLAADDEQAGGDDDI